MATPATPQPYTADQPKTPPQAWTLTSGKPDDAWLARQEKEPILEPELPIIDTHHHLWDRGGWTYLLPELLADLNTGHNIVATIFEECIFRWVQKYAPEIEKRLRWQWRRPRSTGFVPVDGRNRRVWPVAVRPDEGRLTEPTAATQSWPRLPLFMPHLRHSPAAARPSQVGGCRIVKFGTPAAR